MGWWPLLFVFSATLGLQYIEFSDLTQLNERLDLKVNVAIDIRNLVIFALHFIISLEHRQKHQFGDLTMSNN